MSEYPEATNGASPHLTDELLAAWAADELAGDERGAIQRHLDTCAYCQSALAETQRIRALARASATSAGVPVASASLVERVLARLPDQSQPARDITARALDSTPISRPSAARRNQRRDVWRRVGALAAVLLLIASSAVLFSRLSERGPAVTSTFTPGPDPLTNIPGNWAQVLPERGDISDVAVVSPTDIWAVGGIGTPNDSGSQDVVLLHFDGREWHRSPESFPGAALGSISMVSANEGWASGGIGGGLPFLLHYTNGHWRDARTTLTLPNTPGLAGLSLTKIQMASATSGWMLAQPTLVNQTGIPPTQVYEYDKVGDEYRWEPVISWQDVNFSALAALSDREVWFVGGREQTAIAIRMTDSYLDNDPQSHVISRDTREFDLGAAFLTGVNMRSADDGWAVGGDDNTAGTLFHWDGAKWTPRPFAQTGIDGVVMTGDNAGWFYNWDYSVALGYLYSTADNQWFSYPLASDEWVAAGAAITPTTFLAIVDSYKDPRNPVPVPRVYTMGHGTPVPTATSIAP